ncbi:unnamed protein product [Sphagnum jensenii]|uniref:Uncharacterized protein n=1 Tax=Sphagnum jensenii TaxID=128206 RepID=A0ABP1A359_9BRYO
MRGSICGTREKDSDTYFILSFDFHDFGELPGFYFDADRNRYFPLSSKCVKTESEKFFNGASSSTQGGGNPAAGDRQEEKEKESEKTGVLQLIQQREFLGCGQVDWNSKFRVFTTCGQVWEYNGTNKWADGALQQLRVSSQTNEGEKEADVLVLGGSTGRFGLCVMAQNKADQAPFHPQLCLPSNSIQTSRRMESMGLWPSIEARFSSGITAIKRLGEGSHALVTTLGSAEVSGSLYVLSLKQIPEIREWDRSYRFPFSMSTSVKTGCSVWTTEGSPNGTVASLGMNTGAARVEVERCVLSWLYRSSSACLSQQFDKTGNILLCGFRNGVISTVDLRLPPPKESGLHFKSHVSVPALGYEQAKQSQNWRLNDHYCSHSKIMRMNSAICSMVLMHSDENYLLASAMNGVIQQWDRRMVENGAVRTYEGHSNTHTSLQMGVDPSETFLVSGGEDCAVRIWSLTSGRLLHTQTGFSSPTTSVCWPASLRVRSQFEGGGYWEEFPFETDHTWGLWLGSSSGLQYMHGASS